MFGRLAACACAGVMVLGATQIAEAKSQTIRNSQLTINAGEKTNLQDLYAWDKNCRPLNISFRPGMSLNGKLYAVPDRFRVKGAANDPCNGKSVTGKRVVFEAKPGFKGKTTVSYSVKTPNYSDTFIFTRPIRVR